MTASPAAQAGAYSFEPLTGDGWAINGPDEEERHGEWSTNGYGLAVALDRETAVLIVNALNEREASASAATALREALEQLATDLRQYHDGGTLSLAAIDGMIADVDAALAAQPAAGTAEHIHRPEYPSACSGCEHLAADLASRMPPGLVPAAGSAEPRCSCSRCQSHDERAGYRETGTGPETSLERREP